MIDIWFFFIVWGNCMNPENDGVAALPSHYCRDTDCKLHHQHKMAALKFQLVGALFLYGEQKQHSVGYLNLQSITESRISSAWQQSLKSKLTIH